MENYAVRFSQDPNWVYLNVDFDTIMLFAEKWLRTAEYDERFNEIESMMRNSGQK